MAYPTPSSARIHDFTVVSNEPVAEGVYRLTIEAPRLAAALEPGQFMSFEVPGDTRQLIRIPLSYSSADAEAGTVTTYYAVVGDGTRRLSAMGAGSTSTVLGPGGHGWKMDKGAKRVLVVAGGIGITPVIGITLPFFSYGGSSLFTSFAALGMVSGIHFRPKPKRNSIYY